MHRQKNQFKRPPKKYEPKGCRILYEDRDLLIVDKSAGVRAYGESRQSTAPSAQDVMDSYVKKGNYRSPHSVKVAHFVEPEASGVLIGGKSQDAVQFFRTHWEGFSESQKWVAVVHGKPELESGSLKKYLIESSAKQVFTTKDKEAGTLVELDYKVIRGNEHYSLIEFTQKGDFKHAARVLLADAGFAVVGDRKYGDSKKKYKRLCLHHQEITVFHPYNKQEMICPADIPPYFEMLVRESL